MSTCICSCVCIIFPGVRDSRRAAQAARRLDRYTKNSNAIVNTSHMCCTTTTITTTTTKTNNTNDDNNNCVCCLV